MQRHSLVLDHDFGRDSGYAHPDKLQGAYRSDTVSCGATLHGLGPFKPPLSSPFRPQPSIAHRTSRLRTSYRESAMASVASDQSSTMPRGRKRRDVTGKVEGRKFTCETAGCGRSFTRAEHLQRHLLNHSTGEHTCDRCRAHFKRRDLLGKTAFLFCIKMLKFL